MKLEQKNKKLETGRTVRWRVTRQPYDTWATVVSLENLGQQESVVDTRAVFARLKIFRRRQT